MSLIDKYTGYYKKMTALFLHAGPRAVLSQYKMDVEEGNVQLVMGFIVIAIVMAMGVVILYSVNTSTPAIPENSSWYSIQTNLATTTQSGYGLLGIILIVMAAAGILSVLYLFAPRQK